MNKPHKHNWILTQRIPEIGYYSQRANEKKEYVDFEFTCPDCTLCKRFTKKVEGEW